MIDLILVYCMLDTPDRCVEKRAMVDAMQSMNACMFSAQGVAQEYVRLHPGYALNGFRCEQDHPREEPA